MLNYTYGCTYEQIDIQTYGQKVKQSPLPPLQEGRVTIKLVYVAYSILYSEILAKLTLGSP